MSLLYNAQQQIYRKKKRIQWIEKKKLLKWKEWSEVTDSAGKKSIKQTIALKYTLYMEWSCAHGYRVCTKDKFDNFHSKSHADFPENDSDAVIAVPQKDW